MIIRTASADFLEAELEIDEWPKLLGQLGISQFRVCLVRLCILRGPIDEEDLYAKSSSTLARALADKGSQLDAFEDPNS